MKRCPLGVRRPHAAVSSDASSDSLRTQETAEDKLIIYQHYATDDQRGVAVQTRTSTRSLETGTGNCRDAVFLSLFNIFIYSGTLTQTNFSIFLVHFMTSVQEQKQYSRNKLRNLD